MRFGDRAEEELWSGPAVPQGNSTGGRINHDYFNCCPYRLVLLSVLPQKFHTSGTDCGVKALAMQHLVRVRGQ